MICKLYYYFLWIYYGIFFFYMLNNFVYEKLGCLIFISFWRSNLVNMDVVLEFLVIL